MHQGIPLFVEHGPVSLAGFSDNIFVINWASNLAPTEIERRQDPELSRARDPELQMVKPIENEVRSFLPKGNKLPSDDQLANALRIITMRLTRRLRYGRSDDSLGPTHLAILVSLNRQGPMTPTALADLERIAPPWVTRVVTQLNERGLVERLPHPDDRRQRLVKITEGGKRQIGRYRASNSAWLAKTLINISDDERRVLRDAFKLLEEIYEI